VFKVYWLTFVWEVESWRRMEFWEIVSSLKPEVSAVKIDN